LNATIPNLYKEKKMSRENAIARAEAVFDDGTFFDLLTRWVSHPTESQNEACREALGNYLTGAITPYLENLGFACRLVDNPVNSRLPFLIGRRMEGEDLPTVLTYGHGDTVLAMDGRWREGLAPWQVVRENDRWYGRGTADNKGQHAINLAALACVLEERRQLGFNVNVLIEMGEEMGSAWPKKFTAGIPWRCWPLNAVTRRHRSTPFPPSPGKGCESWPGFSGIWRKIRRRVTPKLAKINSKFASRLIL
jgi:hypothetical protein